MKPKKKRNGMVLASLIFLTLIMTCGTVTLALSTGEAKDKIFPEGCRVTALRTYDGSKTDFDKVKSYQIKDEEAFKNYIGSLKLYKLTGTYDYDAGKDFFIDFNSQKGDSIYNISLSDGYLNKKTCGEKIGSEDYVFYEDLDIDYILSLLEEEEREEVKIESPDMLIYPQNNGEPVKAGKMITYVKNGGNDGEVPEFQDNTPAEIEGDIDAVKLEFTEEISSYTVNIFAIDGYSLLPYDELKSSDLNDNILPVEKNMHYEIDAVLKKPSDGITWRMHYSFNVI